MNLFTITNIKIFFINSLIFDSDSSIITFITIILYYNFNSF